MRYTNADELQIVTLENVIYLGMKNDFAFVIDCHLHLYEHQSSVNPNMPLRDLFYVADEYQMLTADKTIYSSRLVKIPTPKFIVFYNGTEELAERTVLRLSDAFEIPQEHPELEEAVEHAVNDCIKNGILAEFLRRNRLEVLKMSIYEYNEEVI